MQKNLNDQELVQTLNNLGNQIGFNNQLLLDNVQAIASKAEYYVRKGRKKQIGQNLIVSENSYLSIKKSFDDGSSDYIQISNILTGKVSVYKLVFRGNNPKNFFAILFENEDIFITGIIEKLSPRYIFERFIMTLGPFLQGATQTLIANSLFEYFAPKIEHTNQKKIFPSLAGWDINGDFFHADNFIFRGNTEFSGFPVFKKSFENANLTQGVIDTYFHEINNIFDEENRLLIALCPFQGIINSLFYEMGKHANFSLNFIDADPISQKEICALIKIFNRKSLIPITLDLSEKKLDGLLSTSNDEVIICDARYLGYSNTFQKKIKKNQKKVINATNGRRSMNSENEGISNFSCVLFSDERILEYGVKNIFVGDDFFREKPSTFMFMENKVMEALFSNFIPYVRKNLEIIWEIMIREKDKNGDIQKTAESVYEILTLYWEEKGISFSEKINLSNPQIWKKIIDDEIYNDEEILGLFIEIFRKQTKNICAIEKKRNAEYHPYSIYYSEEYIWIPTEIFRKILANEKMFTRLNNLLQMLKEHGELVTDNSGFSRKIQVSGNGIESYQIRRNFFNSPGIVEIIDLAKGEKNA